MSRPMKECPLCISKLTNEEYDFYPCPCGYQVCAFCFEQLKKCALCQRPFDADASKRIGPQFKPSETNNSVRQQVVSYYLAPKIVQIIGLPENICKPDILRQTPYLGQYGPIKKISVDSMTSPSAKTVLPNIMVPVFVKFRYPKDAESCILAIDGITLGNQQTVYASIAVVEQCPKMMNGRSCSQRSCLKRHREERPSDENVPAAEIDAKDGNLKKRINPTRPLNYLLFPKRVHCVTVFPPPRLAPSNYFPFQHTRLYSKKPPSLFELVTTPNVIPPPTCPRMPQETVPLSHTLGMEM